MFIFHKRGVVSSIIVGEKFERKTWKKVFESEKIQRREDSIRFDSIRGEKLIRR